jgi:hypothetical protein
MCLGSKFGSIGAEGQRGRGKKKKRLRTQLYIVARTAATVALGDSNSMRTRPRLTLKDSSKGPDGYYGVLITKCKYLRTYMVERKFKAQQPSRAESGDIET